MRIDELDTNHKEFKKVTLDQDLTEEQLDEILPVIGAVAGGVARGAMAVGGAAARGAAAVARGVGSAVGSAARGIGQAASAVGRGVGNVARKTGGTIKQNAKDQINKKVKSFAQDTADKLANQNSDDNQTGTKGTTGSTGTIGSNNSQSSQAQLQRGSELSVPIADPKNPQKTVMTPMKIKNVTGQDIELEPKSKKAGVPGSVKFNKKDLAL